MKVMPSTATVTTRPLTRSMAAMAPAMSIWLITQPPKMSPAGLVSAGMARVLMVSAPLGWVASVCMGLVLFGTFDGPAAHSFLPMLAAKGEIDGFFDGDLVAIGQHTAGQVLAHDHCGLGSACADGANFAQGVGYGQQFQRAGKELALEVRSQAIAHDGNIEPIGHTGQLPGLFAGEELGLIDKDAIDLGFLVIVADGLIK